MLLENVELWLTSTVHLDVVPAHRVQALLELVNSSVPFPYGQVVIEIVAGVDAHNVVD